MAKRWIYDLGPAYGTTRPVKSSRPEFPRARKRQIQRSLRRSRLARGKWKGKTADFPAHPSAAAKAIKKTNDRGFRGYARMCGITSNFVCCLTGTAILVFYRVWGEWPRLLSHEG